MESEIVRSTAELVTALERADVRAAAAAYADGARLLAPSAGLIEGRAAIKAYWRAGVAMGLSGIAFSPEHLDEVGGYLELGRYAIGASAQPRQSVVRGTYLVLHTRDTGGSWRRAVEVFNADEPASANHDIPKEER